MENSRIIELIAKKTGKIATEKELQELVDLLSRHPHYAYLNEIVQSLKGSRDHFEKNTPREELADNGWQQLAGRLNTGQAPDDDETAKRQNLFKSISLYKRWIVAAAVLVFFICGTALYYKSFYGRSQAALPGQVASTKYGITSSLVLADGTQVRLNAGSKLTYPEVFSGSKREVYLDGEAFFEVTKNPKAPFLVHAGKITVKVLGTTFNVKAYSGDANIETTLISGKVHVMLNDDPEKEIVLSPHEKLTVTNPIPAETNTVQTRESNALRYQVQALPVNTSNNFVETAWLNHKLVFSNESFDEVARQLERKYNVHVYFRNNKLKEEHISGIFEKENISKVLEILKMTTRFNYTVEGADIYLF